MANAVFIKTVVKVECGQTTLVSHLHGILSAFIHLDIHRGLKEGNQ